MAHKNACAYGPASLDPDAKHVASEVDIGIRLMTGIKQTGPGGSIVGEYSATVRLCANCGCLFYVREEVA